MRRAWADLAMLLATVIVVAGCAGGAGTPYPPPSPVPLATTIATNPAPSATRAAPSPAVSASQIAASPPPGPAVPADAIWIPGVRVAMVPPETFEAAIGFAGFQHLDSGSSILVLEIAGPYDEVSGGITAQGLVTQRIEMKSRDVITQHGLEAILVEGTQDAGTRGSFGKVLLVTGTETATAIVNANYPHGDEGLREAILAAVRTTVFDPDRPVDPTAALTFTIQPSPPLQPAGVVGNGALYNVSGRLPSPDPAEPVLIVAPSLGAAVVGDPEGFARQRLAQLPYAADVTVESVSHVTVAGRDGVEILASGGADQSPDRGRFVYQLLLIGPGDSGYVLMVGYAPEAQRQAMLEAFRATAETFAFKG